jgi:hypothetical protein
VSQSRRCTLATGRALEHRDVDETGWLVLAAADLSDLLLLETELFGES